MKKGAVLVTGSAGLIGYETTLALLRQGFRVIGVDNDLRARIFGVTTQYKLKLETLRKKYPGYRHFNYDIRHRKKMEALLKENRGHLAAIVHTAAQTSHDWAKKDPDLDFSVNAYATLQLLQLYHAYAPQAAFIFTSTNKVYGDRVNSLPFLKLPTRFDLPVADPWYHGINETFSVDQSTHSLFGVSKTAADLLVQEYGRYFGLPTGVFRLGVITGEGQSDSIYQGFLTFVIRHALATGTIQFIGYEGRQVRDILHAGDLAQAFLLFIHKPKSGKVYNLGGGRENALSLLEIRERLEKISRRRLKTVQEKIPRTGDHKWWITDYAKFNRDYGWKPIRTADDTIKAIISASHHDAKS